MATENIHVDVSTERDAVPAGAHSETALGRRLGIDDQRRGRVRTWPFGAVLCLAGVGAVVAAGVGVAGDAAGAWATLGPVGAAVGVAGVVLGLLGVWLRYGHTSVFVRLGVLATTVGFAGGVGVVAFGTLAGRGAVDDVSNAALAAFLVATVATVGVPAGLSLLGLGLRESVDRLAWLSLAGTFPLWFLLTVAIVGVGVAPTFLWLGLLTAVPLGVAMLRRRPAPVDDDLLRFDPDA